MPRTFRLSFTVSGTPSSGPRALPSRHRCSLAAAAVRAPAASSVTMALRGPFACAMRSSNDSTTSTGEKLRRA
jgi:hypothetical protein